MPNDFIFPGGPYWGPDFVEVTVDAAGGEYRLQIYPDAKNPELRAAGLAMQFYFQPKSVRLAKKADAPDDYDFSMTLFKGLLTSDRDIVVTDAQQEVGGGWCTFTTTSGVPNSVLDKAVDKIVAGAHSAPADRIASLFNYRQG